jgi:membrane protein DedA with SNARE-associated domain
MDYATGTGRVQVPPTLQSIWNTSLAWLNGHEALFIFLAILLEESGIPMPIPADIAMALAGYRVAQGQMSLLEAFMIGQSATLIGSSILYWAGRRGGRPLLARYGRFLLLSPERLAQAERLITRLGPLAVVIGRQIPGLRLASPLACGVFQIPYRVFLPAMFLGSTVYIGAFIALGVYGGPAFLSAFEANAFPFRFILTTITLVASLAVLRVLSQRASDVTRQMFGRPNGEGFPPQVAGREFHGPAALVRVTDAISRHVPQTARRTFDASMLAGLASTVMMGLAVSWLLELAAFVLPASPEYALLRFLEWRPEEVGLPISPEAITGFLADQTPMMRGVWTSFGGLLVTIPLQVIGHLGWALVYGFVLERRLRGSPIVRGLQFAFALWITTGVVIYPLVGAGPFGAQLNAGWAPFAAELVRYAVFGTALGATYDAIRLVLMTRPGGSGTSGTYPAVPKLDTAGEASGGTGA